MLNRIDPKPLNQSVQEQATGDKYGTSSLFWNFYSPADGLLKPWGSKERDMQLRRYWLMTNNTLVQGAISNLIKRITATPWEISGGRNLTRRYQEMLQNAEFGAGWKDLWVKVLTDYFTQDFGGVIEVIGPGNSDKPIRGGVTGLAQLDRQRCLATGDVEYPIVYYNDVIDPYGKKTTTVHRMHYTRVIRMTDMVSPIERSYGNGLSALSRAIGVSNAQILMGRYQNEKLSNAPPVGLITFGNVRPGDVDVFKTRYAADRQADGSNTYAPIMEMQSIDPANPIEVNFIPFAQLPDSFNYKEYMEAHVNLLALALGEDPQDIWPLTGGSFGTGTQSIVLAQKGRAKSFADCLTMIERALNLWVLPRGLEFAFKFTDSDRDKEEAETAQIWINAINSAPGMTDMEKRTMMANRIPAFADVLFDAAGNVRLPDDDVEEDEATANDDTALEAANTTEATTTGAEEAATSDSDIGVDKSMGRGRYLVRNSIAEYLAKDYMTTQTDFIRALTDLINAGMSDEVSRRRFGTVLRGNLSRLGRQAYKDGLEDGGVEGDLDDDALKDIASILSEQSGYVTAFANSLFSGAQVDAEQRATMWANKSLDTFYQRGLLSANANGMYEWKYGATEHCADCQRLNGQKHRLKEWHDKGWIPKSSDLECKGYNCECVLVKTKGRAKGSF